MNHFSELDIVIRQRDGKFIAGIPAIGLYAKAKTIESALSALEAKRVAFVVDLDEAGELNSVILENKPQAVRSGAIRPPGDLRHFAAKVAIVTFCLAAGLVGSAILVTSKVESAVEKTVRQVKDIKVGGAQFWSNVEASIDRMASPTADLPEAKKQKLLADIHAIAVKWRPFIAEIQAAFSDPGSRSRIEGAGTK